MSGKVAAAHEVLPITNPNRFLAIVRIALAVVLGGYLLYWSSVNLFENTLNTINAINNGNLTIFSPQFLTFVAISLGIVMLGLKALANNLWLGTRAFLDFSIPTETPKNLQAVSVIDNLLEGNKIVSFDNPSSTLIKASNLFNSKFMYLTEPFSRLVEETLSTTPKLLIFLLLMTLPALFNGFIQNTLKFTLIYPLPWTLAYVVVAAVATRVLACMLMTPAQPEVKNRKQNLHVLEAGNPKNFYNHIMSTLDALKVNTFPNREYRNVSPVMVNVVDKLTSTFSGDVVIETQPQPVDHDAGPAPYVLALAGALILLSGFVILLDTCAEGLSLRNLRNFNVIYWAPKMVVAMLAGRLAITTGKSLIDRAYHLFNLYYFSSDVYRLNLDGTFTTSHIGLVPGARHGGLESNRVSVQSDCHVQVNASHIISESNGLANAMGMSGNRVIISTRDSAELQENMQALVENISSFRDSSGHLPPVKPDPNVANLININSQIAGMQAAAERAGALPLQPSAPPLLLNQDAPAGQANDPKNAMHDKTTCPKCGADTSAGKNFCGDCGHDLR